MGGAIDGLSHAPRRDYGTAPVALGDGAGVVGDGDVTEGVGVGGLVDGTGDRDGAGEAGGER
jgi:hypothetical protein